VTNSVSLMTRYYRLRVTVLFLWGALSDERAGLYFVYAAVAPWQRGLSRVRVPWDSRLRDHILLSDLRLPFSSPPTTRRVTVEVFDSASTRGGIGSFYNIGAYRTKNTCSNSSIVAAITRCLPVIAQQRMLA
jgi:hypothetical protein